MAAFFSSVSGPGVLVVLRTATLPLMPRSVGRNGWCSQLLRQNLREPFCLFSYFRILRIRYFTFQVLTVKRRQKVYVALLPPMDIKRRIAPISSAVHATLTTTCLKNLFGLDAPTSTSPAFLPPSLQPRHAFVAVTSCIPQRHRACCGRHAFPLAPHSLEIFGVDSTIPSKP